MKTANVARRLPDERRDIRQTDDAAPSRSPRLAQGIAHDEPLVCVVNAGWPRLSTTFVAQELVGLERMGLRLRLATYGKNDVIVQPIHKQLRSPVVTMPKPFRSRRLIAAWLKVRGLPGYARARALFQDRLREDSSFRQRKYFARAILLAADLPADAGIIYSHFISGPSTVAMYAAAIAGLPLAISAHARDIWVSDEPDLRRKLRLARWCATCTGPGAERLRELADDPSKIELVHHGLSFDRFPDPPQERELRDGSNPGRPVRLLSVGRAVEKKGFGLLLEALAQLPPDLAWTWEHVGSGPMLESLQQRAAELNLSDRIRWNGAQGHGFVFERYRTSDLFILPSLEAGDGDRDGLPNVLMEAQTQALACLSTRFSAIPELIEDGATGVLVEPGDREALSGAIAQLIASPEERRRLGLAGCERVRRHFRAEDGIRRLAALLRRDMRQPASAAAA